MASDFVWPNCTNVCVDGFSLYYEADDDLKNSEVNRGVLIYAN